MPPILRLAFALLALCLCDLAVAQPSMADCADRLAGNAPSDFDRLPQLQYACLRLGNGRHVLVGEGGDRDGPVVLLVHGLGNNAHRDWRATVPALVGRFRVVALDLPGFGASQAFEQGYTFEQLDAALSEVVDRLSLRRFHLVGHSLGGAISLHFAHRHPQLVDRLVLANAAGILLKPVFVRHLIDANTAALGVGPLADLMGVFGQGGREGVLDLLEDQAGLTRWLLANPTIRGALFGMEIHADAALGLVERDFTAAIREIEAPTTIIWGRDDPVTPLRTGKLLAARMLAAQLVVLDRSQHMPMNQQPAEFNAALIEALAGPAPAKSAFAPPPENKGSVTCTNQPNMRYSGVYDSISLSNCSNARIENAHVAKVTAEGSSLILENVIVSGEDTAVIARTSTVTATGVVLSGRTAIRAEDSTIDLAGASVRARERGVEAVRSRLYFSVSDYEAPEYRGPAHFAGLPPVTALP
jgi:pimeloyl-ACP methyl ester carboxylesterase